MRLFAEVRQLWTATTVIGLFLISAMVAGAENQGKMNPDDNVAEDIAESEMIGYVQTQLENSLHIEMFVRNMIDNARKEKDTVRILCIDDKLTKIQTLLQGIQKRVNTLELAINAKDSGTAKHQFVILQVSFNKLNGLRTQADTCVGNSDIIVGASESEVKVSEEITTEEATTPEQEIFTPEPTVRPTVASGFR
ncbi:MAG: hypothetical protein JXR76_12860 [Deltaproteobacteria bacterium]|nr:hypothetical protein [Deltaproteobacteria bacterium]